MKYYLKAVIGGFNAEIRYFLRSKLIVLLTLLQSVTFILLVSIFGLTGSRAPTALVDEDKSPYSAKFRRTLETTHHSFSIRYMDLESAMRAVRNGELVAVIIIPKGFNDAVSGGRTMPVEVIIDNIDTDLTGDIQRAMPSAIVSFARQESFTGIHIHVEEHDLVDHDTGFIPYLIVSALALCAFVTAGILSAAAVAGEFETDTIKLLKASPVHPLFPLTGRILAADAAGILAMAVNTAVVIMGYGVMPIHPALMVFALLACVIIFGCAGALIGGMFKRILPSVSLIFGLSLPLYIDSGSMEPERFDGNLVWGLAHLSPVYYAIGVLEYAFHGLVVTPESVFADFLALSGWAVLMIIFTGLTAGRRYSS